ncbi:Chromosome transmission fidelity protein 18 [Coemansia sp. RSA 2559]|nr:Chromosome transmission fidelity protein 18 [Coemansia sp. RSA 2559]KAJ2869546.1 Chromosome transmission fidelity protein 18 [Coemansia erecta]
MKPEELDLRHSLLGSTLGTFIPQTQSETSDRAESAVTASNQPGNSCAEFPDTYDGEMEDDEPSAGLTLLPTAEYSEEEESDDESMSSQFGQFSDASMECDPYTGLQRHSVLSEDDYWDAAYQGEEVARMLSSKQLRDDMELKVDLANKSVTMVSASERYDAYKSVLERHARMDEKIEQQCKRQKTEHTEEESGGLEKSAEATAVPPVDILSAKYALPPETGDFVTSRTSTGRTLYFGVRTAMDAEKKQAQLAALKDEGHMESSQINRAVANIEKALDIVQITAEEDEGAADESAALWVDKYRARTFLDLVSDERTNRAVMQWLKEWDHCVFGRRSEANAEDKWRRPRQRILLLAGPPGLGKTTLAHVTARQAGYAVVEINASDDRTVSKVRDRVLGVTQTHRLGASKRPQLLIIDEIDGVSSASPDFVAMLVKLATDQPPGRRRKQPPLLRPIICICNNAYAQALRPLRAMALSYHVHAPTPARLAKRLTQVCEAEGVAADTWALVELADQNAGDIRACLNALQLRRASGTALDACGTKDVQRPLFSLWAMLFTTPAASFLGSAAKKASAQEVDRRYTMLCLDAVRASGERDRLIQGCFENYLRMDFRDLTHSRVADLCSALCFYDTVDLTCRRNPATSSALQAYLDYAPLAFHRTCRTPVGLARGDFAYPHSEYDAHQQLQAAQTLVHTLSAGCLSPRASLGARTSPGFVDFLLHILSPQLTTANKHLLKGAEKARFERLVAVMSHWQLSFVQCKDADGQLVYKMEPPIDRLFGFAGRRPAVSVVPMRYPVRQLVAQELDRIRIARAARSDPAESSQDLAKRDYLAKLFANPLAVAQQDSAGETDVVAAPARDFFGRIVAKSMHPTKAPSQPSAAANGSCLAHNGSRTWFHFFEGFSNAVRKPTQMKELL